jgi:hypothetical protein
MKTAICLLLLTMGCRSTITPPPRPALVPADAEWAGGRDGGKWILCKHTTGPAYDCSVYNDYSGKLEAQGQFVHSFPSRPAALKYSTYDGVSIHLQSGQLLPEGWINYPFGDGGGKRVLYERGQEKQETTY